MAYQRLQSSHASKALGLATPVQFVKGIGPRRASILKQLGIQTVRDLLYYFPYDYIDLSRTEKIGNLRRWVDSRDYVTVIGTVRTFDVVGRPPKQRFLIILGDDTGTVPLVFFKSINYFKKAFSVGETLAVSGKVTLFMNRIQIVHPSIDRLASGEREDGDLEGFLHTKGIVPKYSSSQELQTVKLDTKGFRRVLRAALDQHIAAIEEFLPTSLLQHQKLVPIQEALQEIHFPQTFDSLRKARRRLKFDELFFMELLLAVRRRIVKTGLPGISFSVESKLARQLVDSLPFRLTKAQVRVIKEIAEDMKSPRPMNRLLQGDVGSGKTIVALTAMLIAVDNGFQAAFMAPTEILAEQHYRTLVQFLENVRVPDGVQARSAQAERPAGGKGVNIRLLIGAQGKKLRDDILEDIQRGTAQIVVGTHALVQEHVQFGRLGLIIIDEQHRFGVSQRLALREKGFLSHGETVHPDVLVMTATPIPRTLSLTLYGDLDVSMINELPLHRKSIKTVLKFESQRDSVYAFLREDVARGRQAYIVYPLVEESEKLDLKAATESYALLQKSIFPDLRVGLIHGRMSSDEKEMTMDDFKNKRLDILVATTVIEVGIDVPNATVMVIEHAERLGLAQLHQLRGRVGRGADQSHCILIAPNWMSPRLRRGEEPVRAIDDEGEERRKAVIRLKTMLQTTDGFKIAEVDLRLRGPGEFFGTRQSGYPELRIADLLSDTSILTEARREAFELMENDPHLRLPDNSSLRRYLAQNYRNQLEFLEAS